VTWSAFKRTVEDKLANLSCFTATSCTTNQYYLVGSDCIHDLVAHLVLWQLATLRLHRLVLFVLVLRLEKLFTKPGALL
jgi:hypothetical protein